MHWSVIISALSLVAATPALSADEGRSDYQVVHGWPVLPDGFILGPAAGVAVDSKGHVWVFQRGDRIWQEPLSTDPISYPTVVQFDGKNGKLLQMWGAGVFAMPHGLSIDDQDNIWLTDVSLHQVFKFSPEGKQLLVVGEHGVAGDDGSHFNRPTDVAVLPDGSFYVSDGYRNTRVVRFSCDGEYELQWGTPGSGPGEFNTLHGIAVDRSGDVYVADRENDRVQVFDEKGRFLRQWQSEAMGRPYGLSILPDGRAAVVDGGEQQSTPPGRSAVAVVRANGDVAERFGRFGNQDGQFRMGHDIATDAEGNLYVVDITGQRVQKFVRGR